LVGAAEVISTRGEALQLRYLQTLTDIAQDRSTVIAFPIPVSLGTLLAGLGNNNGQTPNEPSGGTTAS
jgi:hypothetical protein